MSSLTLGCLGPWITTPWFKMYDLEWALTHLLSSTGNFAAARLRLGVSDHYYLHRKPHAHSYALFPHDQWDALVMTEHDRVVAAGNFGDRFKWIAEDRKAFESLYLGNGAQILAQERERLLHDRTPLSLDSPRLYYAKFLPKSAIFNNDDEKYEYNVQYGTALFQYLKGEVYSFFGYGFYWEYFKKAESKLKSERMARAVAGTLYTLGKWRKQWFGNKTPSPASPSSPSSLPVSPLESRLTPPAPHKPSTSQYEPHELSKLATAGIPADLDISDVSIPNPQAELAAEYKALENRILDTHDLQMELPAHSFMGNKTSS